MKKVAKFEKVSLKQFKKDWIDIFQKDDDKLIETAYHNIKTPTRSTVGSAGYDFVTPVDVTLSPGQEIKVPTGIHVYIDDDWVLKLYPRSGLGFKYRLQLNNTVGIIDSDYFYSDNEGHIMAKITNDSKSGKLLQLKAGDRFMQGIFVQYGITVDDYVFERRNGGFGSTDCN